MNSPHLQHVALNNYRSFANCHITLDPLTILVGRNGAGKSNFLDAIEFTKDAIEQSLDYAVRERAGIDGVRRRSKLNRPTNATIELRIAIPEGHATYGFTLRALADRKYDVSHEQCVVRSSHVDCSYEFRSGKLTSWRVMGQPEPGNLVPDRLALTSLSGIPELRMVYEGLTRMAFHNLNPDMMKQPSRPSQETRLARDGENIAAVVAGLTQDAKKRILRYLNRITGLELTELKHKSIGSFETFQVSQKINTSAKAWTFDAASMSDGTLRALGILASAFSNEDASIKAPYLIGIEEPENALHPAAAGILAHALLEAAASRQVILTTHSPELIGEVISPDSLRVVIYEDGESKIAPLSAGKKDLLQNHLSDAGELLRLDQLSPDPEDLERQHTAPSLFDSL